MSVATYQLLVDWNNDGDFADANEDVTGDVISVECSRGRDYASQLTGRASAGRLSAVLLNTSGKYASFNAASPLSGSILPGRPVTLKTTAPAPASLWYGYLDTILPDAPVNGIPTARLEAAGPFIALGSGSKQVNPPASAGALTGTLIGTVLDAAGWSASARSIDAGRTTTGRWYAGDVVALEALRQLEDTDLGFLYEGADGALVFEDRYHRLLSDHLVSQATFTDAPGGALGYVAIQQQDALREIYNEVPAEVKTYTVAAVAVLWTLTGETPSLSPGETRTWYAQYPGPAAGNGASYVDTWTTPVVGTDVTQTGVSNSDLSVSVTKAATIMAIRITNTHATASATLSLVQARGTAVSQGDRTRITATDPASQATYGQRTYVLPAPWLPDSNVARDYCAAIVARYKAPRPTLAITVPAHKDSTHLAAAVGRAISDRVTVVAANTTQLGINSDFFIESIAHRIDRAGSVHLTTFTLSSADSGQAFWILGTAALGTGTVLGY